MIKPRKKIPTAPGIYFFKDGQGKILYIGKTANLKNRLASYFNKQDKDLRISKMLGEARKVDWQEVGSEIEALILESRSIKRERPKYNILMRDDKQYFYISFTDDEYPRIKVVHQIDKNQNKKLKTKNIGPFTDGGALRVTLKLLRKIFPYCTCKQKHINFCLNYHIGNCLGYCCLRTSKFLKENEYRKNIESIKKILSGKKIKIFDEIRREMKVSAKTGKLESTMALRDKLEKLGRVFENAKIIRELELRQQGLENLKEILKLPSIPRRIEGYDISNIQGKYAVGSLVVFTDGQPDKNLYRKFKIKTVTSTSDTAMLEEVLERRLNHAEWPIPDLIVVDGGKAQLNTLVRAINNRGLNIGIIALTKNEKHQGDHLYVSDQKNSIFLKNLPPSASSLILWVDFEAHRFAISYYRVLHRKVV